MIQKIILFLIMGQSVVRFNIIMNLMERVVNLPRSCYLKKDYVVMKINLKNGSNSLTNDKCCDVGPDGDGIDV